MGQSKFLFQALENTIKIIPKKNKLPAFNEKLIYI